MSILSTAQMQKWASLRKGQSALVSALLLFFGACQQGNAPVNELKPTIKNAPPKTIMAIFAHPDDETIVSPLLAKYADSSNVHLVLATDGRYGVTDHAGIPAGDSLIAVRKAETECACAALGIRPPHFLGAKDGLGLNGHHNFYEEVAQLKTAIKEKIALLRPTTIITFGPDGDTGHPDHRMVGLLTKEILLREGWATEIDLYHFGWLKEQTKKFPEDWGLGYTRAEYMNTAVRFRAEDEEKAFTSLRCHKSQYTKEEMDEWIAAERKDTTNILYFRKFSIYAKKAEHF